MLSWVIKNGYERNMLIYRGKTANEIYESCFESINDFAKAGVNKAIVSVGTVDVLNDMVHGNIKPKESASNMADVVLKFKLAFDKNNMSLVYVVPAGSTSISDAAYAEFQEQLRTTLRGSGIKIVMATRAMEMIFNTKSFRIAIKEGTIRDGIHWQYKVERKVLEGCFEVLGLASIIDSEVPLPCTLLVAKNVTG